MVNLFTLIHDIYGEFAPFTIMLITYRLSSSILVEVPLISDDVDNDVVIIVELIILVVPLRLFNTTLSTQVLLKFKHMSVFTCFISGSGTRTVPPTPTQNVSIALIIRPNKAPWKIHTYKCNVDYDVVLVSP